MNDDDINYADIAPTDETFWVNAHVINKKQTAITVELDEDLVAWLQSFGSSYHVAINNLIRSYYVSSQQLYRLSEKQA